MKYWKSAGVFVRGRSHIKNEIPCQDSVYSITNWNMSIISLADGAGSCKHSKYGAEISTRTVCKVFNKYFNRLYKSDIEKIKTVILGNILKFISRKAKELNAEIGDFASTLLFVAIKGNNYIIGHIGDGLIGKLSMEENLEVISFPENNEYANYTYFTTSKNVFQHFRITKGKIINSKGFILMSDGSAESLYDRRNKTISSVAKQILEWLDNNSTKDVSKALEENIKSFIIPKTSDDCSINLMKLVDTNIIVEDRDKATLKLITKIRNLFNRFKLLIRKE